MSRYRYRLRGFAEKSYKNTESTQRIQMRILLCSERDQFGADLAELEKLAELEFLEKPDKEMIARKIARADILVPGYSIPITEEIMDAAKKLRLIQVVSVGYENIDAEAATRKGIMVCNTGGVNAEAVAELTWGLILCLARQIPGGDRLMRNGGWGRFLGEKHMTVWGKTLGIIGFGAIGQRVALKGRLAFNMRVIGYDPYITSEVVDTVGGGMVSLEELLRDSDVVSIHVPLMESTRHLIGEKELGTMKASAFLINTARGAVVDEKALIKALKEKKISGAGLDVFETEPLQSDSMLRKMDNVVMVSHIGTDPETGKKMASAAVENMMRFVRGERPMRIVNPSYVKFL
jgi:lactate dehydrogenase-like 2-hydroxyacid dehydrogenase